MAGFCDCGNGPSGSIKCGEFLVLHAVTDIGLPIRTSSSGKWDIDPLWCV